MPTISIEINTETNFLTCKITPENNLLESFFESEIQGDLSFMNYLVLSIDNLSADTFEINGNAHCLMLTNVVYKLTPLHDETSMWVMGPLSDFKYFLGEWKKALLSRTAS